MSENKNEHVSVKKMWDAYLNHIGDDTVNTDKSYTSWHFCNDEENCNELAELVKIGQKKATASAVRSYEFEGEELPKVGDHSIITNWEGEAQFIIKTSRIDIVPFREVTEEFAATEGEGDGSLEYWRDAHIYFFKEEFEEIGEEFTEDALTVCERFEVVFPLEFVK